MNQESSPMSDEKLAELFERDVQQHSPSIPNFEEMWQKADEHVHQPISAAGSFPYWKIAALFALVTVAIAWYFQQQDGDYEQLETFELAEWKAPTDALLSLGESPVSYDDFDSQTHNLLPQTGEQSYENDQ